jgi:hypothetical protein
VSTLAPVVESSNGDDAEGGEAPPEATQDEQT